MHYLSLPRTTLRVSSLCLGTADFGAGVPEDLSFKLLDHFAAAGGNFLDTAAIYADWTPAGKGSSEMLLGRWMKERGNRGNLVIATKGGHPELASMSSPRLKREAVQADLDASLANLGVDTIDLYYLHRDDPRTPVSEILGYLEDFVEAGKIRNYAFSNWHRGRAEEARLAETFEHASGFIASQLLWSLAEADLMHGDRTLAAMDEAFADWHIQHGIPAIPYSSQAGGYFNKLAAGTTLPEGLRRMYDSPLNRLRFQCLRQIQSTTGLTVTQIVLGYLLSQEFPVVPIIGCKNMEQLADSLSGADIKLSPAQVNSLETAVPLEA